MLTQPPVLPGVSYRNVRCWQRRLWVGEMATEHCGGFVFDGEMSTDLELAPCPDDPDPYYVEPTIKRLVQWGTPSHKHNQIRIAAPKIIFKGNVTAVGDGYIQRWRAQFMQTITEASWGARYSNGKSLRWRLNTTYGPLNDCYDGYLYPHFDRAFSGDAGKYKAEFTDNDYPAQLFFKEYSGDPFNPNLAGSDDPLGKLSETEGRMRFCTYLAVVNDCEKTVITLAEHHWVLRWDGQYDFANGVWTSDDIDSFIEEVHHDRPGKYEKPDSSLKPALQLVHRKGMQELGSRDNGRVDSMDKWKAYARSESPADP